MNNDDDFTPEELELVKEAIRQTEAERKFEEERQRAGHFSFVRLLELGVIPGLKPEQIEVEHLKSCNSCRRGIENAQNATFANQSLVPRSGELQSTNSPTILEARLSRRSSFPNAKIAWIVAAAAILIAVGAYPLHVIATNQVKNKAANEVHKVKLDAVQAMLQVKGEAEAKVAKALQSAKKAEDDVASFGQVREERDNLQHYTSVSMEPVLQQEKHYLKTLRNVSETPDNEAKTKLAKLIGALDLQRLTADEVKHHRLLNSYSPSDASFEPKGTARVTIRNERFPCRVTWKVGDTVAANQKHFYSGDTVVELPAGELVSVYLEPVHTAGWLQPFGVARVRGGKSEFLGSALGKIMIPVQDGDQIVLYVEHPCAPWNTVCVPIKGEWAMVTLERPWSAYDSDKFLKGEWKGPEEYPNTAIFWARGGSEALAKELAAYFIENRKGKEQLGRFRGKMHTSIHVAATPGGISAPFLAISQKDLEGELFNAFELLRKQKPSLGKSVQEEIDAAKEILAMKRD